MIRTTERLWKTVRNGNVIEALLYRLKHVGICIELDYRIRLGAVPCVRTLSEFEKEIDRYTYSFLTLNDMKAVQANTSCLSSEAEWMALFKEGKLCFAAHYEGQVVAILWICVDTRQRMIPFSLKADEAYLFSMRVDEQFRGKKIAACLYNHCSTIFAAMGIHTLYCYCSVFNRSSIRSLLRAKAEFLTVEFSIKLFDLYHRNIVLKRFIRKGAVEDNGG